MKIAALLPLAALAAPAAAQQSPSNSVDALPDPVMVRLDSSGHLASPPSRFEPDGPNGPSKVPPPGSSTYVGDVPSVTAPPPSPAMRHYWDWAEPTMPNQDKAITLISGPGAPPEPPGVVVPPRPLRPAQSYLKQADYPRTPLVSKLPATVWLALGIGATGRVKDCGIVHSSGWRWFDSASCLVMTERARFRPAKDANGHAVRGDIMQKLEWKRP